MRRPAREFVHYIVGSIVRDEWWHLSGGGPVTATSVPSGLEGAPRKVIRDSAARELGATSRDVKYDPNRIVLPVRLRSQHRGDVWIDQWGRWRRALGNSDLESRFYVRSSLSGYRWQDVRLDDAITASHPPKMQFGDLGRADEEVHLVSDRSLWTGFPTRRSFRPSQFGTAQLINLGDVESWLKIRLVGPGNFRIGVTENESLPMPPLAAGQELLIDTDIENQTIRNQAGVDQTAKVGLVWFDYSVPPGPDPCQLTIGGTGFDPNQSRVEIEMPHHYIRAIG